MNVAARTLRIRPGEGRATATLVAMMFVSMAAIAIGESGVDALFFDRIGPHALPLMYLGQAGATIVAMLGLTGVLGRLGPRRTYVLSPVALAAVVLGERAVLVTGARWIYPALWITVAFAMLGQGIGLWGTAGSVVDTRQAKRLFPIFGAGGILGSVVGGLATRPLASAIGAEDLLFVWAAGLVAGAALCRLALGPVGSVPMRSSGGGVRATLRDVARGLAYVRRSRLLRWMTAAAVLFSVLYFSLFLPFARVATERFPDADKLAGFFGIVWAAVTGTAFLVSMLLTNRLFGRFGVPVMIVVLPLLYAGAFGILLVETGFVTVVLLRVVTGVWLQGVASPGWETLVNVVPERQRDQTRAFLNGGPSQVGTAIAGLVALVGQRALSPRQLAAIGLAAAGATVVVAIGIRRSYAGALVEALRAGRPRIFGGEGATPTPVPLVVDAEATRVLAGSLHATDPRARRLAFQLVAELPTGTRPDDVLTGLVDLDPTIRWAAVRSLDPDDPEDRRALDDAAIGDPDPAVAAAAAAKTLGRGDDAAAAETLRELLANERPETRRDTLEQLWLAPADRAAALVEPLVHDPVADVRAAALDRIAADPARALAVAPGLLRDPDPAVRLAAGRALGAAGPDAVDLVLAALADPLTADAAVEAARRARLDGDRDRVRVFVVDAAQRAASDHDLAAAIPAEDDATALLRDAVRDRARRVARAALWAAAMLADRRDAMAAAIDSLDGGPSQLANALETLEAAGDATLVRPLLAFWEPAPAPAHATDGAWLERALHDDDPTIRQCAELVRARREGAPMSTSPTTIPVIERVLFLRKVPLFSSLPPLDLERVARIAEERGYADGEPIGTQGEPGDDLHIVVEGTIRVVQERDGDEHELARRGAGDVVGELSILRHTPRMASLIAEGNVRTIRIGHREFESMLRERPEVALGVMRVLADRVVERTEPS